MLLSRKEPKLSLGGVFWWQGTRMQTCWEWKCHRLKEWSPSLHGWGVRRGQCGTRMRLDKASQTGESFAFTLNHIRSVWKDSTRGETWTGSFSNARLGCWIENSKSGSRAERFLWSTRQKLMAILTKLVAEEPVKL